MSEYSPFDTPFDCLEASHLAALRAVSEGWYVEYKREVPNAGAVAKSVGAMANTYIGTLLSARPGPNSKRNWIVRSRLWVLKPCGCSRPWPVSAFWISAVVADRPPWISPRGSGARGA
jgi:hypothetical protein